MVYIYRTFLVRLHLYSHFNSKQDNGMLLLPLPLLLGFRLMMLPCLLVI
jgi:hypothetical protein